MLWKGVGSLFTTHRDRFIRRIVVEQASAYANNGLRRINPACQ